MVFSMKYTNINNEDVLTISSDEKNIASFIFVKNEKYLDCFFQYYVFNSNNVLSAEKKIDISFSDRTPFINFIKFVINYFEELGFNNKDILYGEKLLLSLFTMSNTLSHSITLKELFSNESFILFEEESNFYTKYRIVEDALGQKLYISIVDNEINKEEFQEKTILESFAFYLQKDYNINDLSSKDVIFHLKNEIYNYMDDLIIDKKQDFNLSVIDYFEKFYLKYL